MSINHTMNDFLSTKKKALSITIPIMLGYIPLGMAFGFLLTSESIAWYYAPLFSIMVFAGTIQFLAIAMLVNGVSYTDIAIATLLVNFRHIFYGLSLFSLLPANKFKKLYFIFCITDENYSLLTSKSEINKSNALFIVFVNHLYWILGSLIGATLASQIMPIKGLDFSLTALFCILFIEQFKKFRSLKLLAIAILSCYFANLFYSHNFLIAASLIALLLLYIDYSFYPHIRERATHG